ncbi:MAG: Zn-dependent alcohol dehydrogenase [Leifsonia xyli]|nr:MAG: Zn-dependent alcohol dehydrogenase [Leifsonia xyli]
MIALVKTGPRPEDVELQDREPPVLPASGHVRVRVAAAGICGTDLHILDGSYSSRPPVTLGHEVSGVVEELSADVDASWRGARVALETFYSTCGTCEYCRAGRPNLCELRVSIGSGADGGFGESLVVPVANLHRLPEGMPVELGALAEPLACVCQSLFDPSPAVSPGDRVLVIGPGAVGLIAAQVARAAGADVVVSGTSRDTARLAIAEELGFATAVAPVSRETIPGGWASGPDVVVECSGSGPGMAAGLELIRKRGRYVQMGQTGRPVEVPLALVSFKELTITGGFASTPTSWRRAMALLGTGAVEFDRLATHRLGLSRWREAFDGTAKGEGMKYLLSPDGGTDGGDR